MQLISCQDGKLVRVSEASLALGGVRGFWTGLEEWDDLLPAGGLARGAVHEVIWDDRRGDPRPGSVAALLARAGARVGEDVGRRKLDVGHRTLGIEHRTSNIEHRTSNFEYGTSRLEGLNGGDGARHGEVGGVGLGAGAGSRPIVWADARGELYPPALGAMGISLGRLFLLRASDARAEGWAVAECLACRGVGAVVAEAGRLTRVAARRMRLSAERGGGAGVILRAASAALGPGAEHAATTRWLVAPAPGQRTMQRWQIQLIHGHGGRLHRPVYLEFCRERHEWHSGRKIDRVRAADAVGGGPLPPAVSAG